MHVVLASHSISVCGASTVLHEGEAFEILTKALLSEDDRSNLGEVIRIRVILAWEGGHWLHMELSD